MWNKEIGQARGTRSIQARETKGGKASGGEGRVHRVS